MLTRVQAVALATVALAAGAAAGWLARGTSVPRSAHGAPRSVSPARDATGSTAHPRLAGEAGDASVAREVAREVARAGAGEGAEERARGSAGAAPVVSAAGADCASREQAAGVRIASLERALEDAQRDRAQAEGEPIPMPDTLPPRFSGPSVRAALEGALEETRVEGRLEELDCSEHPCLAFGRLRGDEEDAERIERSRALSPYRDDVLTLLFWAVTDEAAPRDRPGETGLFAIAFFERADRERFGDRLDRRIRARAVELWATMRPGWDG